jgi:hypothetical protein
MEAMLLPQQEEDMKKPFILLEDVDLEEGEKKEKEDITSSVPETWDAWCTENCNWTLAVTMAVVFIVFTVYEFLQCVSKFHEECNEDVFNSLFPKDSYFTVTGGIYPNPSTSTWFYQLILKTEAQCEYITKCNSSLSGIPCYSQEQWYAQLASLGYEAYN